MVSFRSRIVDWLLADDVETKQIPPTITMSGITPTGSPVPSAMRNARTYAQYGYQSNVTVYRAITIVAQACASVDWKVYKIGVSKRDGKKTRTEIYNHPLNKLLEKPNNNKARSTFIEQLVSYWMISGTNYLLGSFPGDTYDIGMEPLALYNLRPDLVEQIAGANGEVAFYDYDVTGTSPTEKKIRYPAWKVLPLRFFHPLDELSGLSVIQVAAAVVERQNAGEEWNYNLMRNMARPSGAFVAATEFSDEGRARLRREIQNKYGRGKHTAGMPMLLENGLTYIQLAINPVDADWFNSDAAAGRKIASAIGVDPLLLQDKQYSTYNNELEAKLAMWELTCFPLMEKLKDELNGWLVPFYGSGVEIDYDREPIESLKRNRQMESVTTIAEWNTGLRSFNSSATDLLVEPIDEKDDFYRFAPNIFVRRSDISEFLDAQKTFWQPQQPTLGNLGRPQTPFRIGGPVPQSANPAIGQTRVNVINPNVIPTIQPPGSLHSLDIDMQQATRETLQFRHGWEETIKQGLLQYHESEALLLIQACKTQKEPLATFQLHATQLQELLAGYYASVAMEAGKRVAAQFGEKFVLSREVIEVLGEYAGKSIAKQVQERERGLQSVLSLESKISRHEIIRRYYVGEREQVLSSVREHVYLAGNIGAMMAAKQTGLPLLKTWVSINGCDLKYNGMTTAILLSYDRDVQFPLCQCTEIYSLDLAVWP